MHSLPTSATLQYNINLNEVVVMHSLPTSLSGKSAIEVLYAGKIVLIFYLFFYIFWQAIEKISS